MVLAEFYVRGGWVIVAAVANVLLVPLFVVLAFSGDSPIRSGIAALLLVVSLFATIPAAFNGDDICVGRYGLGCDRETQSVRRSGGDGRSDSGGQGEPETSDPPLVITIPLVTAAPVTPTFPADLQALVGSCLVYTPDKQSISEVVDCLAPHDATVVGATEDESLCPPEADALFTVSDSATKLCVDEA